MGSRGRNPCRKTERKGKRPASPRNRDKLQAGRTRLARRLLGAEVEFELDRRFGAGWNILPILQRFLDGTHQQGMTTDHPSFLNATVGGNYHLHLYNANQVKPLRNTRVNWYRI